MDFSLKYGQHAINFDINHGQIDLILPQHEKCLPMRNIEINFNPLHVLFGSMKKSRSDLIVGIAINDKTRPVPYPKLIPPLINELLNSGVNENNIYFFIANGTHVPDNNCDYLNLNKHILNKLKFIQHNCQENLIYLGKTYYGTPILINRMYYECDIKISVGNIEPHHFAGYSGGVKTVSIGLAGKETITHNHALLINEDSVACEYNKNKVRMDIEEIGEIVGLNLALNCIQTKDLEILDIFFENPKTVMQQAMPCVDKLSTVEVGQKYDLVIASAGGYPKDINFYQSQKATSNASKILKNNGSMLVIAECREGVGSDTYFEYIKKFSKPSAVISDFEKKEFVIGQHKAYLMAKLQSRYKINLFSSMPENTVRTLLIEPVNNISMFIINFPLDKSSKIAIMPNAVTTIPKKRKI